MGDWKKEFAKDIVALGSIPFYALVLVRVFIGEKGTPFYTLTYQILAAAVLILALSFLLSKSNNYVSRSLALLVFTSINYEDGLYTLFASALWVLLLVSLVYSKAKKTEMVKGFIVGLASTIASYYLVNLIL